MAQVDEREIIGFRLLPGFIDRRSQSEMVMAVRGIVVAAPLIRPVTRWGKPMSVRMTSAGRLGWVITAGGHYTYTNTHPATGKPWPPIPQSVLAVWRAVSGWDGDPDC